MGKRGPKKTPTIVLRNRGSWRGSARKNEPVLPIQAPEPPDFLSPIARAKWDELTPILADAGILTKADKDILTLYCQTWSDLVEIEQFCRQNGKPVPMIKTQAGNLIQNPAIGLRNSLRKEVRRLAACLGITPADRSNVKAASKAEPEDKKKRFFRSGA